MWHCPFSFRERSGFMSKAELLREIIDNSENIVFFGGAGVSTESGIPDFRSSDGLYNQKYKYPPEQIVSHTFFKYYTEAFYEFYKEKMIFTEAKPNKAHKALAILEEQGKLKAVITQNIDGLHQAEGSRKVYELHGSVHRNFCMKCGESYGLEKITGSEGVPLCDKCGGVVKPDVVLYEESLDQRVLEQSVNAIRRADTMIIGGTSLNVYPAAGLIHEFAGDKLILINKSATQADNRADLVIREPIGQVFAEALGI